MKEKQMRQKEIYQKRQGQRGVIIEIRLKRNTNPTDRVECEKGRDIIFFLPRPSGIFTEENVAGVKFCQRTNAYVGVISTSSFPRRRQRSSDSDAKNVGKGILRKRGWYISWTSRKRHQITRILKASK